MAGAQTKRGAPLSIANDRMAPPSQIETPAPLPMGETLPANLLIERFEAQIGRLSGEVHTLALRLDIRTARVIELEQQLAVATERVKILEAKVGAAG